MVEAEKRDGEQAGGFVVTGWVGRLSNNKGRWVNDGDEVSPEHATHGEPWAGLGSSSMRFLPPSALLLFRRRKGKGQRHRHDPDAVVRRPL